MICAALLSGFFLIVFLFIIFILFLSLFLSSSICVFLHFFFLLFFHDFTNSADTIGYGMSKFREEATCIGHAIYKCYAIKLLF